MPRGRNILGSFPFPIPFPALTQGAFTSSPATKINPSPIEQKSLARELCRWTLFEGNATQRYGFGVQQLENRSNAGPVPIQPMQMPRLSKVLGVYTRIAIATVASLPVN
jgi:hypothetical protein